MSNIASNGQGSASAAPQMQAPHAERRHSFRIQVAGRASLWRKQQLQGHYDLQDLSIAGCCLKGSAPCVDGEQLDVVLHLPDCPPIWLSGQVRRRGASSVALHFAGMPAGAEDRLQDLVVDAYARAHGDRLGFVLVVDPREHVRRALLAQLRALGERALAVATPLDAVQLLVERGDHVESAFLGPQPSDETSAELSEFLGAGYPHVRRILMGEAGELAASAEAEASGQAEAILELPCTDEALRRLLHRISSLPRSALS